MAVPTLNSRTAEVSPCRRVREKAAALGLGDGVGAGEADTARAVLITSEPLPPPISSARDSPIHVPFCPRNRFQR